VKDKWGMGSFGHGFWQRSKKMNINMRKDMMADAADVRSSWFLKNVKTL